MLLLEGRSPIIKSYTVRIFQVKINEQAPILAMDIHWRSGVRTGHGSLCAAKCQLGKNIKSSGGKHDLMLKVLVKGFLGSYSILRFGRDLGSFLSLLCMVRFTH